MTIRTRLTLLFTLLVATLLLVFCLSIYYFSSLHRKNEFYNRLKAEAYASVELLFGKETISPELFKLLDRNQITVLYAEEIIIYNYLNEIIYESGTDYLAVDNEILNQVRLEKEVYFKQGQREIAGIFYTDKYNRYVVFTSAIDKYGYSKQANLALILSVGWLVMVLVVFYAGRIFSFNALQPITRVIRQVAKITASNLNLRVEEGKNEDEIKQLANTFNEMLNRLEEAFRAQRSFISHASHELRTPLTAISGQIEVALLADQSVAEYKAVLTSLHEDTQDIIRLSNGLLSLAGLSTDTLLTRYTSLRLDELLWQARSELLGSHPDYTIRIRLPEMPEDDAALFINGNALLLKAVFINLMENGCKFSPKKQVKVELAFEPQAFRITFTDEGIGIVAEDLPHIFEPFFRAANVGTIPGHGIGLSLARRIIDLHQGSITIHSVLKQGTTIAIILPRHF
ncbi:HAMP domain-containing sensor histidine kinase [Rhodocytophaga aerolata]|uniref:histidine kinase n=1 Tax=Rhodocytophaga aerolata TaxID=455078 RepID=A0ABT8RCP8_9BACT|nr:HAMP domain-containing sensor histidine kinase [Rhodocytophaga aerolata]MDO1449883.1 HAMP domain-containing sensor histidine kinase [Rhodocytophaga aerolata]